MPNINKCFIGGHIGKDPETKTLGSTTIITFSLATTERWTGKDGTKQSKTTWHRCEFMGKRAESVVRYLRKGMAVLLEGRYISDEYVDKQGNKKSLMKLRVDDLHFLESKRDEEEPASRSTSQSTGDDDLPF